MGLHLLRPMIKGSGRGRKKTVRKKAHRRRSKNTEEGDKYLLWGRRRNGLTDNFTLTVSIQFLVAADNLPYTGPYAGRGPRRKYWQQGGARAHPDAIPQRDYRGGHIQTCIYQAHVLHKEFTHALNVVIIVKTNVRTQARAHVILFSSDLTLAYAPLMDYYGLRFSSEFHFRDAKQYWGLEDFMNVTPTGVTNAANFRCSWSMWRIDSGLIAIRVIPPTVFQD